MSGRVVRSAGLALQRKMFLAVLKDHKMQLASSLEFPTDLKSWTEFVEQIQQLVLTTERAKDKSVNTGQITGNTGKQYEGKIHIFLHLKCKKKNDRKLCYRLLRHSLPFINFRTKCQGLNFVQDDRCINCGVSKTSKHALMQCTMAQQETMRIKKVLILMVIEFHKRNQMQNREIAREFSGLCKRIGITKVEGNQYFMEKGRRQTQDIKVKKPARD